ncbi:MAG TPA: SAM-dependent chlorinase/fluorinase [Desulfatiglandales bacterium]|nr:SAM-dependent chlorinase/fluorinase [Desulfatiglandales bacterium]
MIPSGIITLTTDFGETDPYVAVMKGVILSINPDAKIVDLTHQVPAGSIQKGALMIKEVYPYFPAGTVHLGVIDPGVGGERRPIAIQAGDHCFVGPDNGLFWPVIEKQTDLSVIHLTNKKYWMNKVSPTFHGRDIFAPISAHLSMGANPFLLGEKIHNPITLDYPLALEKSGNLIGEIIKVDNFGNLITNITREQLSPFIASKGLTIKIGDLILKEISTTYSDVPKGSPLALIGSSNLLEIAVNMGNVVNFLGRKCKIGTKVIVTLS